MNTKKFQCPGYVYFRDEKNSFGGKKCVFFSKHSTLDSKGGQHPLGSCYFLTETWSVVPGSLSSSLCAFFKNNSYFQRLPFSGLSLRTSALCQTAWELTEIWFDAHLQAGQVVSGRNPPVVFLPCCFSVPLLHCHTPTFSL